MTDQLILFKTAVLAKEKGFREITKNGYCNDGYKSQSNIYPLIDYFAPTQSLLQKWLREKHNLNLVTKKMIYEKWKCFLETITKDSINTWWSPDKDTYEEALEQGLLEALKLI